MPEQERTDRNRHIGGSVQPPLRSIFSNVKAKIYLPFRMILPVPTFLARRARRGGSFVSSSCLHHGRANHEGDCKQRLLRLAWLERFLRSAEPTKRLTARRLCHRPCP